MARVSFQGARRNFRGERDVLAGSPVPAQSYQLGLRDGVDPGAAAKDLEKAFAQNGLQAVAKMQEIEDGSTSQGLFNDLLMGFMGLGLLVGIVARSGVERRQQIGMLRALGFQRGQVRLAFLIESSLVALLGIGLGVGLGALGRDRRLLRGADLRYPLHGTLEHAGRDRRPRLRRASLLTTFLPASQASRVYPAEALRYE